jgi:hypothetical protein
MAGTLLNAGGIMESKLVPYGKRMFLISNAHCECQGKKAENVKKSAELGVR